MGDQCRHPEGGRAGRTGRRLSFPGAHEPADLLDRFASRTVVVGGLLIIFQRSAPFSSSSWARCGRGPRAAHRTAGRFAAPGAPRRHESRCGRVPRGASSWTANGALALVRSAPVCRRRLRCRWRGLPAPGHRFRRHDGNRYVVGTSDGRIVPFELKYDVSFDGGTRTSRPSRRSRRRRDGSRAESVQSCASWPPAPPSGPVTVAQIGRASSSCRRSSRRRRSALAAGVRVVAGAHGPSTARTAIAARRRGRRPLPRDVGRGRRPLDMRDAGIQMADSVTPGVAPCHRLAFLIATARSLRAIGRGRFVDLAGGAAAHRGRGADDRITTSSRTPGRWRRSCLATRQGVRHGGTRAGA